MLCPANIWRCPTNLWSDLTFVRSSATSYNQLWVCSVILNACAIVYEINKWMGHIATVHESPDRWSYLEALPGLENMALHEWSVNGSKEPQDSWLWFDATVVATINWDDIINGVFTNSCQCVSILSVVSETDSFVQCRWALFRVDPAQKPYWQRNSRKKISMNACREILKDAWTTQDLRCQQKREI